MCSFKGERGSVLAFDMKPTDAINPESLLPAPHKGNPERLLLPFLDESIFKLEMKELLVWGWTS